MKLAKAYYTEWNKNRRLQVKNQLLDIYGRYCHCCGENRFEFLTLDHIGGGGNIEKRKLGSTLRLHTYVVSLPKDTDRYRILCYNCNMSMGNIGYCPHQKNDKTN